VPAGRGAGALLTRDGDALVLSNGSVTVRYDLRTGLMDIDWPGVGSVRHAYAAAAVDRDGEPVAVRTPDLSGRAYDVQPVADALGRGQQLTLTGDSPALGAALVQRLTLYNTSPFLLMRTEVARLDTAGGDA